MNIVILGHRGLGPTSRVYVDQFLPDDVTPENTLLAFDRAMVLGARGVELDVYLTKDNEIVVCRDDILDRNVDGYHNCWGAQDVAVLGKISEKNFLDLQDFDLGKGQKIPTLKSVIDLMLQHKQNSGVNFKLNIELQGTNLDVATATWEMIRAYIEDKKNNLTSDNFVINSFNKRLLIKFREAEAANPLNDVWNNKKIDLMLGVYTYPLFGSEDLYPNWVPVEKHGELVSVKDKVDEGYLQELIIEMKKYDINYLDVVSSDLRENLLSICAKNGISIAIANNSARARSEYLLRHPDCDINNITDQELEKLQLYKLYNFAKKFPEQTFYYKTDHIKNTLQFLNLLQAHEDNMLNVLSNTKHQLKHSIQDVNVGEYKEQLIFSATSSSNSIPSQDLLPKLLRR